MNELLNSIKVGGEHEPAKKAKFDMEKQDIAFSKTIMESIKRKIEL